ncbi:SOS response-associated peptidase [Pontibacter sp. Tf4]|uniref:SOS response-associated peptidase n=1 Tax=Pontibacter sp. Tf4 TaxID=2761620 RepID=UPI0021058E96|nr:SOS response-associated peptidase [Pontibacter sp. Tf4]
MEARYNAAPSHLLPVVTGAKPDELQFFSWGLVPHWFTDLNSRSKPINARAETLLDKPSFRELITSKRCLVPANGFYEWRNTTAGKIPYRFLLQSEALFSFAGLWDTWADKQTGKVLNTFTIISTQAYELVKPTHDRMPVVLYPEMEDTWLTANKGYNKLRDLLQPFPAA